MVDLIRYIKGYVRIRVWGVSPERFMNLCGNKNILLWDIRKEQEQYVMSISLRGFFSLRPIARKTGTRVVVLERRGLPFFLPGLWSRKAFLVGFAGCVAFWWISSLFVWDIQLDGNVHITDEVMYDFLESENVTIGMLKDQLDIESLEKALRQTFPEVTWTSARLDGTKLLLSIKENDAPILSQEEETDLGMDLVAEYAGTITFIVVRTGVPMVKAGDVVEAGDILVEGRVPVYQEDSTIREYLYVNADADIRMEHEQEQLFRLPAVYTKKVYTGREKQGFYIRVGKQEISVGEKAPFLQCDEIIQEETPAFFARLGLPVYWGGKVYREYLNTEYEYTVKEVENIFESRLAEFILTLEEKGVQIIEKNVKIESSDIDWTMTAFFLLEEDAGMSVRTTVEEKPVELIPPE